MCPAGVALLHFETVVPGHLKSWAARRMYARSGDTVVKVNRNRPVNCPPTAFVETLLPGRKKRPTRASLFLRQERCRHCETLTNPSKPDSINRYRIYASIKMTLIEMPETLTRADSDALQTDDAQQVEEGPSSKSRPAGWTTQGYRFAGAQFVQCFESPQFIRGRTKGT